MFQVLVVGGYNTPKMFVIKFLEYGLGYGTAYLGFRATAELINQDEGCIVAMRQEMLHVAQVGGICRQVIFNRLVIAYVDEDAFENPDMGIFIYGGQHAALGHVLHYAYGFKAYGLATCVRAGNNQYAVVAVEGNVERYDFFPLASQ